LAKIPLQKINPNRKIRYARDEIHRTKILNRKRRRKLRLMTLLVVFLILFILGLLSLRHQAIRIEDIEISGNKVIAKDSIL
jgi:cell division septal protein FtsQ